jgi:hypothetical protein
MDLAFADAQVESVKDLGMVVGDPGMETANVEERSICHPKSGHARRGDDVERERREDPGVVVRPGKTRMILIIATY